MTNFGFERLPAVFNLTKYGDFFQPMLTPDGSDWPDGTVLAISFDGADADTPGKYWTATFDGPTATWNVDKAVVNALVPLTPHVGRVVYTNSAGADIVYYKGPVRWLD